MNRYLSTIVGRRAGCLTAGAITGLLLCATAAVADTHQPGLLLCDVTSCKAAPTVATDIDITVTGIIARTRVTQRFYNPTSNWVEGLYAFPLPDGAAVDHLTMYVGSRTIEGRIEERGEARRTYETARDTGVRASLVEQDRPNLFRTSVANVGPDETIEVEIQLQHLATYDSGELRLRFPTVAMPRYEADVATEGEYAAENDDTTAVNLVNALPRALHPINPLRLEVALDAGYPLRALYSPTHQIGTNDADGIHIVSIAEGAHADRDFVLVWQPQAGAHPAAAAFYEHDGDETYALLMLLPPAADAPPVRRVSREVVYVIDSSGSMGGASMGFAKLALLMAIDQLRPGDWFDVIDFDDTARSLFGRSVAADADTIEHAREFVTDLAADGGTNIGAALDLALEPAPPVADVRQVVFLTDGAVGNEAEIFAQVAEKIDETRLFTVGIGSAPNDHFMRKAAHFGRGTYTFVGSAEEISDRMEALFAKLDSAVLTDIEIQWSDAIAPEVWPQITPDLYEGEPLVVTARLESPPRAVALQGDRDGERWSAIEEIVEHQAGIDHGIGRLWARAKIDALMDDIALGADREELREEIIDLAIEHNLVTSFTSLVAVDDSPSAPPGAAQPAMIPANYPAGSLPDTATPAILYALIAFALILAGVAVARPRRRPPTQRTKKTARPHLDRLAIPEDA